MADLTFPMYRKMVPWPAPVRGRCPLPAHPDLAALAAAVTPRNRLLLVCNPNNPTGTMVEPGALLDFAQALPPRSSWSWTRPTWTSPLPRETDDLLPLGGGRPAGALPGKLQQAPWAGRGCGWAMPWGVRAHRRLGRSGNPSRSTAWPRPRPWRPWTTKEFRARVVAETTP